MGGEGGGVHVARAGLGVESLELFILYAHTLHPVLHVFHARIPQGSIPNPDAYSSGLLCSKEGFVASQRSFKIFSSPDLIDF